MKELDIRLLEGHIDREYFWEDIKEINHEGITVGDCEIRFEKCVKEFCYSCERGIGKRLYVGARNSLTEPPYIKFHLDGEDVFITFADGDGLFDCVEAIRTRGYDTFDLS